MNREPTSPAQPGIDLTHPIAVAGVINQRHVGIAAFINPALRILREMLGSHRLPWTVDQHRRNMSGCAIPDLARLVTGKQPGITGVSPGSVAILLIICSALVGAGEDGFAHLDPRPLPDSLLLRPSLDLRSDRSGTSNDGGSLAIDRESLRLGWLAGRIADQEFWPEARATRTALHGDLRLPGIDPIGAYLDAAAGATWRQRHDDGRILGLTAMATWSGRSDVAGGLRTGATASAFARLPLPDPNDALLLFLSYDSRSNPLFGVPVVPAVAWQGVRGPWSFLLGLPFCLVGYRQAEWSINANLIPLPAVTADHRLMGPFRLLAEARFAYVALTPFDPPAADDRIYITEWEGAAGLRLAAGPGRNVDLLGGWSLGRRIGIDRQFLASRSDGSRLSPEPFCSLRAKWNF